MGKEITIEVAKYYNQPKYYQFMPGAIFEALEVAFLGGQMFISVPSGEFQKLVNGKNI